MQNYKLINDINPEIFRAYDIRGVVNRDLTADVVYTLGVAIGSEAQKCGNQEVIIGRDGRLSGPMLLAALSAGLQATGCNVINIGEVTTPMVYYATCTLHTCSGVALSGSHNPPDYNGLKIVLASETLAGSRILALYTRIQQQDFCVGQGKEENLAIMDSYLAEITKRVKLARPLNLVVDCGNGVGGKIAPVLLRKLGCQVSELYCTVDGSFPNHQPDPSEHKNLQDLVAAVKQQQADVGLAFDGDADRVGVVTNQGEIIASDRLLMFLAQDVLARNAGAKIVFDVKATRRLPEQIKRFGGIPIMSQTGHSFLKAKLKETGALLAGEVSGHIFYKDNWFGFDDGIYTAARTLELLSRDARTSSEIFATFPDTVNTPEIKVPCAEDKKFALIARFKQAAHFPSATINTIDGLRADFVDGFGLVRVSNTTPYLIMRFEGDTQEALQRIRADFYRELIRVEPQLQGLLPM